MRSMHRHIFHSGMSVLAAVACSLPVWAEGSEAIHDVDNPARQPYRNAVSFYVTDGNFFGGAFFPPVPPGRRLVVETVSFVASPVPSGQTGFLDFNLGGIGIQV